MHVLLAGVCLGRLNGSGLVSVLNALLHWSGCTVGTQQPQASAVQDQSRRVHAFVTETGWLALEG